MRFNSLLNKFLVEYNSNLIEGIAYEQCFILEKNDFHYISLDGKIVKGFKTIKEAKEYIDTINSGC